VAIKDRIRIIKKPRNTIKKPI
jgi:hypothetical protein